MLAASRRFSSNRLLKTFAFGGGRTLVTSAQLAQQPLTLCGPPRRVFQAHVLICSMIIQNIPFTPITSYFAHYQRDRRLQSDRLVMFVACKSFHICSLVVPNEFFKNS